MTAIALTLALAATPVMPLGGDYWKDVDVPAGELFGLADLHAHYFTNLAYGGRVLHGSAWAPGGPAQALQSCKKNHAGITPEAGAHDFRGWPRFEGWPKWNSLVHQQAYVDWIRRAWQGGMRIVQMDVQNTPFLGQVSATANRLFLQGDLQPIPNDDVSAVWIQTAAARALIERGPAKDFAELAYTPADARRIVASGKLAVVLGIEVETLGNFFQRAQLGDDAQKTINGLVETLYAAGIRHVIPVHLVDNAFGAPAVFQPATAAMNFAVNGEYYAVEDGFERGIRFDLLSAPDNLIASLLAGQAKSKGKFIPPGLRSQMHAKGLTPEGELLIRALLRRGMIVDVDHMSERAVDRTLDLAEAAGLPVIASHTGFRDLTFGTTVHYPASGPYRAEVLAEPYATAREKYGTSDSRKARSERLRTRAQVERIRAAGGMIGLQLHTEAIAVSWRDRVPADCDGSSKGFAQQVQYALELFGPQGLTLGTDVGGFSELSAPRFGPGACPVGMHDTLRAAGGRIRAQALAQSAGVRYSTSLDTVESFRLKAPHGSQWTSCEENAWLGGPSTDEPVVQARWKAMTGTNAPLIRARTGLRDWDVNLDGMAHLGMLPDFLQDVANVLRTAGPEGEVQATQAMRGMLRSAEHYVRMWEKLEAQARPL